MKVILGYMYSFRQHKMGLEKYIFYLARELARLGVDVKFVHSGHRYSSKKISSNLELVSIPPFAFKPRSITAHFFSLNLASYLMKQRFDVFHSFDVAAFGYLLLSGKSRRPTLVQSPGFEPIPLRPYLNLAERVLNIQLEYALKYCLEHADVVITLGASYSKFAHENFGVPKENIFELPNGIPFAGIRQVVTKPLFTRSALNIGSDDFVIISVGVKALKGPQHLIEALGILKREHEIDISRIKVLLIGRNPFLKFLWKRIRKLELTDQIIHMENLSEEELYSLYAMSDVAVLPILDISGPDLTVLESMAAGLPVITTNIWENPNAVQHGLNGYLVKPGDSATLADTILDAYNKTADDLKKMGKQSLHIARRFDWRNVAKKAIRLYESLTD